MIPPTFVLVQLPVPHVKGSLTRVFPYGSDINSFLHPLFDLRSLSAYRVRLRRFYDTTTFRKLVGFGEYEFHRLPHEKDIVYRVDTFLLATRVCADAMVQRRARGVDAVLHDRNVFLPFVHDVEAVRLVAVPKEAAPSSQSPVAICRA